AQILGQCSPLPHGASQLRSLDLAHPGVEPRLDQKAPQNRLGDLHQLFFPRFAAKNFHARLGNLEIIGEGLDNRLVSSPVDGSRAHADAVLPLLELLDSRTARVQFHEYFKSHSSATLDFVTFRPKLRLSFYRENYV